MFNWFPYHLLLQKYPRKALYVSLRSAIWAVLKPSHCNFWVSILSLCHNSHSAPNVPIFRLSNCLIQGVECESMPINRIGSSNSWSRPSAASQTRKFVLSGALSVCLGIIQLTNKFLLPHNGLTCMCILRAALSSHIYYQGGVERKHVRSPTRQNLERGWVSGGKLFTKKKGLII